MSVTGEWFAPAIGILPSPQVASTVNGPAVARTGSMTVVAMTGVTTGTPSSFTVTIKLQDSPDGTTDWVDVSAAALPVITTINTLAELNWPMSVRAFVRAVSIVTFVAGTAPTVQVAAIILMGDRTRPS
jgi:hypothetical protein